MSKRAVVAYLAVLLIACSSGLLYEKQDPQTNNKVLRDIIKKDGGCAS